MRKLIFLPALIVVLSSCGNKENGQSIEKLIESKNVLLEAQEICKPLNK